MITKDEFMIKMLFMERVKKVREGRNKSRELNHYVRERRFEANTGKQSTFKRRNVNYDR